MKNILKVRNISKSFDKEVLKNVSFEVNEGEILSIVGESGVGKSTLGKIISGQLRADEGEILFNDKSIFDFLGKEEKAYKRDVQYIFQNPMSTLNPHKTMEWILKEPMKVHGYSKEDMDRSILSGLKEVDLNTDILSRYSSSISGGQGQRILILASLLLEPKLLICDEITSSLDVTIKIKIANLIKELGIKNKLSIIFITHDLNIANYISDRILVIENGSIVEVGNTEDVFNKPKSQYLKRLINARNFIE